MANFCQKTATSLNALVQWISTNNEATSKIDSNTYNRGSNRLPDISNQVPDILILMATSLYQPAERNLEELLVKPHAPLHVFIVSVGSAATASPHYAHPLAFAATTAYLAAKDFEALKELVLPICQSVQSFIGKTLLFTIIDEID